MIETSINEYNQLASKYSLLNGNNLQNNRILEVDELIKQFENYGNDKNNNIKTFNVYKNNTIYLSERLLKFFRSNKNINDLFRIPEETYYKSIESAFNRLYEYIFKKIINSDVEIYEDIKMISISNRSNRRNLIKIFIDKWTCKDKKININL